jgi:hypothetical protein
MHAMHYDYEVITSKKEMLETPNPLLFFADVYPVSNTYIV